MAPRKCSPSARCIDPKMLDGGLTGTDEPHPILANPKNQPSNATPINPNQSNPPAYLIPQLTFAVKSAAAAPRPRSCAQAGGLTAAHSEELIAHGSALC